MKFFAALKTFQRAFSPTGWIITAQEQTLDLLRDPSKVKMLSIQAADNMARWRQQATGFQTCKVEVHNDDWGNTTQKFSKQSGQVYTVLNMANPRYPFGLFPCGGSAQEEDMVTRTTLALIWLYLYNSNNQNPTYDESMTRLINAEAPMAQHELARLASLTQQNNPKAHKVYFNPKSIICFRGPQLVVKNDFFEDPTYRSGHPDPGLSFQFLPKEDIFLFNEIRSAAPLLEKGKNHSLFHHADAQAIYLEDLRRRINAQLDTCIINGVKHLVLSAFGCGEFGNPASLVAQEYTDAITERAKHFEHIVFAINDKNYGPFAESLHNLPLGGINLSKHYKT